MAHVALLVPAGECDVRDARDGRNDMGTVTKAQGETTLPDRTLTIKCTPTLIWHSTNPNNIGATMAFEETASVPNMPNAVDSKGNIDLSKMPQPNRYNDNIDITFVLDPSELRDANGAPITGDNVLRWATYEEGPTYESDGVTRHLGCGWFCQVTSVDPFEYVASPPVTYVDMTWVRVDNTHLLLDDDTPMSSPTYAFMLAFVLPEYGNYYISIDPRIGSKGIRSDNFMLKE